ncbi:MAG TPA: aspartate aminotransferase family protein [Gaiellales bacterium]|jgi:glutamate-1-semialdehyde 2,1-aminomutase
MSETPVTQSIARSRELYERAAGSLAGGVGSGTRAPRSGYLPLPVFVRSGQGAVLTDEDGNTYIDYVMGQGPLILGHRPAAVIDAVTETLRERGSLFSLAHDLEGEAAAAVAARIPSIDLLRFGNSGTECVQYALRFARAFTGRAKILRFEGHYHGWSDAIHWSGHPGPDEWGPAGAPHTVAGSTGMPPEVAETLIVGIWNDTDALERIFAEHGSEIAAVITEPILGNCGALMPAPGYLERMRALATEHGALLIFDEVLTGLRVGPGGAQELFGIRPDLTVLAKALGAGVPVAAVGGRRDIMEMVIDGRTMHGGTYNSNPLVCAAVIAAVGATGAPGFYDDLEARGRRLADGLVATATDAGLEASWSGCGAMFQLWFAPEPPSGYRPAHDFVAASPFPTLYAELRERGVLIQPPQEGLFFLSGGHTDADIDRTLDAAAEAMPAVAAALQRGDVGPRGGVR